MHRRRFLATTGTATATGLAGCGDVIGSWGIPGATGPPRLTVDGRWLTDPEGNRVVLRGVNVVDPWWGTTYESLRGKAYWETLELATDPDEGWHTRVLRIPVEPRSVRKVGVETIAEEYLDRIVDLAGQRGVYVLIDYHAIERYDTSSIDRRIRRFWDVVAPRYADQSHVLYELFNEPTQPDSDGLESWNNWREHAQPWVDLVRRQAPETPIVVGSPRWSSMLRHAPEAPFEGENLLYSGHVFPSWSPDTWERIFGDPALDVPVILSEWGYVGVRVEDTESHMIGSTAEWGQAFREWLDAHENVSWCAWTFDSIWYPPMFDTDWNLLAGDDYMGEFTKQWLIDRRNDHKPGGPEDETATATVEAEPPAAPTNLRVVERDATSVEVAWDEVADPPGGVVIQYRVAVDGSDQRVLRAGDHTTTVSGLEPGQQYEITVVAVGQDGRNSPETATLSVTTVETLEPVATIPRVESGPAVDGSMDAVWPEVESHAIENVLIPGPSDSDLAGSWRAAWDETALYYLVTVTDSTPFADSDEPYQDDNVEIYLDPDHSRESSYDGDYDAQYLFRRGENTIHPGANSIDAYGGIKFGQTETDDGYRVAVAFPWESMGVSPAEGMAFGTDVHVTDDVDGGTRDGKLGWHATEDNAWRTPHAFATVVLGGE